MTTHTTTPPAEVEPSELDIAVNTARAVHDQLISHVAQLLDDVERAEHWGRIADAETRYAEAREARGDIGDFLAAEQLRAMAEHSRGIVTSLTDSEPTEAPADAEVTA